MLPFSEYLFTSETLYCNHCRAGKATYCLPDLRFALCDRCADNLFHRWLMSLPTETKLELAGMRPMADMRLDDDDEKDDGLDILADALFDDHPELASFFGREPDDKDFPRRVWHNEEENEEDSE